MPELSTTLLWLIPLLAATGLVAGTMAGLLGVGGGIVIVPVLYHVFSIAGIEDSVRMHLAVGTSLATIIPTSIRSVMAHRRRGSFDPALFRAWMPGIVGGVVIGTWFATLASFTALTSIFAAVALAVALHMGFGNPARRIAERPPGALTATMIAGVIGAVSAMMGIGGGTLSVPALTLYAVPIHRAVGTAAGFGAVIAIPATLGFVLGGWNESGLPPLSTGYVSWLGFALIVPATVLAAPLGARLAHSLHPGPLRKAFAVFLGLTAARMLWDVVRGL